MSKTVKIEMNKEKWIPKTVNTMINKEWMY